MCAEGEENTHNIDGCKKERNLSVKNFYGRVFCILSPHTYGAVLFAVGYNVSNWSENISFPPYDDAFIHTYFHPFFTATLPTQYFPHTISFMFSH
jgi:hypothetical protein